jgi:hypothetical protein
MNQDPSATGHASGPITDPEKLTPYERWQTEINYAEQELTKFHERGRTVVRRYLDERDAVEQAQKWFNLFFANVGIMKSALYAQLPKPAVSRKFKDYQDDVARVAATILERILETDLDDPRDTFDCVMKQAVEDRLVPGLGTAWLRLETDTEETDPILESAPEAGEGLGEGQENAPANGFKQSTLPPPSQKFLRITDQRVAVDYVHWEDFIWSPCRVWQERRWVGRRVAMSRDALIRRFGEKLGSVIPLNHRTRSSSVYPQGTVPKYNALATALVYEIWDRDKREVIWYCKDYPQLLDTKKDPLKLVGFEPCPEPLFAVTTTSNCTPRPDFFMLQDQYYELDTINNRISMLVRACKVVGVYDRSSDGVQRMLIEGYDNTLIPVDNWAAFAEKGGVKGQTDWLPLEQVIATLDRLYASREAIKQQIYELTGIADIIRGASNARETLGAQQIKAQFASVRIKTLQDSVAKFATDMLRIKAEILVKHYDPELLLRKSNILAIEPEELVMQAMMLLQTEEGFEWRIEITSDSLAQADYAMEKQDRLEFMQAISTFFERAAMMLQQVPQAAPLLVTLLKWATAGFRNTTEIESMLDQTLDALSSNPDLLKQQEKEDPKAAALKAKVEADTKLSQQKLQHSQQSQQIDMAGKAQSLKFKQAEMGMKLRSQQADLAMKRQEAALRQQEQFTKTIAGLATTGRLQ